MIPARGNILSRHRPLRVLVLDDDLDRVRAFAQHLGTKSGQTTLVHSPSAGAAQYQLKIKNYDVAFLDHDLELSARNFGIDDHGSGTDVVDFLARMGPHRWSRTLFVVHSLNDRRAAQMVAILASQRFHVTRRSYAWQDDHDLRRLAAEWTWPSHLERWSTVSPPSKPTVTKRRRD